MEHTSTMCIDYCMHTWNLIQLLVYCKYSRAIYWLIYYTLEQIDYFLDAVDIKM